MANTSYTTLLADWFRVHTPFSQKPNISSTPRTGYAAIYPKIKPYHRQQLNLFACIPFIYKSKKNKTSSSIKGCASFARFGRYKEGESEDDC